MYYLHNYNGDSIWETEDGKVTLFNSPQAAVQYANSTVMPRFVSTTTAGNAVTQVMSPNAPRLQVEEWIDGLFQGFDTVVIA